MARRRASTPDDVSLFPFMSILASIIGVLTLLIASMALAQMDDSVVVRAEQYEKLKKEIDARTKEIQNLQRQVSSTENNAGDKQKEIAKNRKRLEELQKQIDELKKLIEKAAEIPKVSPDEFEEQRQDLEKVQAELTTLQEQIAQLEKELADRKKPPKESSVTILPSGSGKGFDPLFVECAASSIVLHTEEPPLRIRRNDMAKNAVLAGLFKQTQEVENLSIVFLVRDDGIGMYRTVSRLATSRDARHGKLPVVGAGRIDLSYFREKK